ncbi:iron reductase [Leuconostoc mesenteroides]
MKQSKIDFLLAWAVVLVVLPMPLIYTFNQGLVDSAANIRTYDFGILAYVWWLVIVYLSTRPKWIERFIPLPKMYMMHGLLAIIALLFATLHEQMSFTYHEPIRLTGDFAWYLSIFGIVYAVLFMSNWLIDRIPLVMTTKNKLKFLLKHQVSIWVHRLHFVMIGLIWFHVHLIPRVTQLSNFLIIFDLYTLAAVASYVYVKLIRDTRKNSGILVENRALDVKTQMITVRLGKFAPKYQAGDIYFIKIEGFSNEAHPFSVASAPKKDNRLVSFVIQNVGDYTQNINRIPLRSKVKLEGPFGQFDKLIRGLPDDQPIILYGLGSGAAPMLSLAQQFHEKAIHVIWSARRDSGLYLDNEFKPIDVQYTSKNGRFSPEELSQVLTASEIKNGIFIIVGGSATVLRVRKMLKKIGVNNARLIDERLIM